MKQRVLALLVLVLTAILISSVLWLSVKDKVESVVDVHQYTLDKGRTVYLIGVKSASGDQLAAAGMDRDALLLKVHDRVIGQTVTLDFEGGFEPDSSSVHLHAYMILRDGVDVGSWLLKNGLARINEEHTHPMAAQYLEFQQAAIEAERGIWNVPPVDDVQEPLLDDEELE